MNVPSDRQRSVEVKRKLKWLVAVIATAVVLILSLTFYLWEHSPKPP